MRGMSVGLLAAAFFLVGAPAASGQQILGLTPRRGRVGLSFDGNWRAYGDAPSSVTAAYRQWLSLPLSGYLFDPRILGYSLSLRPTLSQQTSSGVDELVSSRLLGLDFAANLHAAQPISLSFAAGRAAGSTNGAFGNHSDFETSSLNAGISFRNRPFPATLSYSKKSASNVWHRGSGSSPLSQFHTIRSLRLSARSSKTHAELYRVGYDDHVGDDDFTAWNARFTHAFKWGKGSRIQSSLEHTDRTGSAPHSRLAWSERLRLQHTTDLSSDYLYQRHSSESNGFTTRSTALSAGLSYRASRSLSLGGNASRRSTAYSGGGGQTVLGVASQLSFGRPLPLGARLGSGFSLGYERRKLDRSDDGWMQAISEPHRVESTRSVILDVGEVDAASVVIRSADETIVYLLDVDYILVETGDILEVSVPPDSRIQVGETILISYRYRPILDRQDRALTASYNASLSLAGFSLSHSQTLRRGLDADQDAETSGDLDGSTTSLSTARSTPVGRLRFGVSRRRRRSPGLDYATYEGRIGLALPPRPRLQISLAAAGTKTVSEGQRAHALSASTSVSWSAARTLSVRGGLEAFIWRQMPSPTDRSVAASMDTIWRLGTTEATLRYEIHRRNLPFTTTGNRLSLRFVRRF